MLKLKLKVEIAAAALGVLSLVACGNKSETPRKVSPDRHDPEVENQKIDLDLPINNLSQLKTDANADLEILLKDRRDLVADLGMDIPEIKKKIADLDVTIASLINFGDEAIKTAKIEFDVAKAKHDETFAVFQREKSAYENMTAFYEKYIAPDAHNYPYAGTAWLNSIANKKKVYEEAMAANALAYIKYINADRKLRLATKNNVTLNQALTEKAELEAEDGPLAKINAQDEKISAQKQMIDKITADRAGLK